MYKVICTNIKWRRFVFTARSFEEAQRIVRVQEKLGFYGVIIPLPDQISFLEHLGG